MFPTIPLAYEDTAIPRRSLEAICIARIHALESVLGNGAAIRWHTFAAAPMPAPVIPLKSKRAPRAKLTMSGEEFFDARMIACRAIAAELGENWHLVEGASHWCTIPSKLRSFKTARGTAIKSHPDTRLPAARYWPAGALPDGVIASPDLPRDRTPREAVRRMAAARELDRFERKYKYARQSATRSNRLFHDARFGYRFDAEERATDIRRAWELRREVLQARRDAAALCEGVDPAFPAPARATRADVMSAEMDAHATYVAMLRANKHKRVSDCPAWSVLVQAAWDARCRLRAARIAYASASSATEPVQLSAAA